jgi:RHS repeat-associated protein
VTSSTVTLRTFFTALFRNSFFYFLLVVWAAGTAPAQTSVTDGATPLALSPGAPAGSYALSGFESVNAYNGNLSFRLPLLRIGGRGGAGYTLALPIERHWRVMHKSNENQEIELPVYNPWMVSSRRYEAGHLEGRLATDPPCPPLNHTTASLSRLTFTTSEGTEYELRDQLTGGQPQSYYCGNGQPYPSRGTVFVTADGSAATFISDTTIRDDSSAINPSGYLSLRDGTRYRIDASNVTWIRDRNGNKLSFSYGSNLMTITDSLNRQVVVQYADFHATFVDQISFKGYGGAQRNIRINFALLHTVLRTNRPGDLSTVQTAAALFPQLTGSNSTPLDWYVVSSIILPDGMQQFQFLYNVYGELARATLPTGGAFEYDFGNGTEGGDPTGVIWSALSLPEIYRRVLRRRTYLDAGSTLESLTTYSRPEGNAPPYVEIDHLKSDQTTLLARERHYFYGNASLSFGQGPLDYPAWREGREYQTEFYAEDGHTLLKRINQTWDQRILPWWQGSADKAPSNNPYLKESVTTLADSGQVTRTTNVNPQNGQAMIDEFNNITDTWVYDFGAGVPGNLLNHTHTDYLTVNNGVDYRNRSSAASPHLLSLPTRRSVYDASEIERARTTYEYDNYSSADNYHTALKDWPAITGVPISGLDASFTSSYPYRGNVTATTRYLLANNQSTGSVTGYAQYDLAGSVVKTIDARSTPGNIIASSIVYDDCFGIPDAEARTNGAPDRLAAANQRSYAFPTVVTNALGQTVYTQFDYYLGRPVDAQDVNGTVFSSYYNDLLDRPVKIIKAGNRAISFQSQSLFIYDDVGHSVTTTSDLNSFGDQTLKDQVFYDGLGRTVESRQYEGGGNYIATRRLHDALGRVYQSSNPFRPWKNETPAWTTTGFDAFSRVISQTTADGAAATISYSGNTVTAADQIGKKRKSVIDALGRLVQVYEDPNGVNWLTNYTHDALGDLINVNQGGQTRTFVYDSLTRLTSATNPENGTATNTYDNNGNLLTSTDARGITINLAYDALNRLRSKTYQNDPSATAPVSYFYDSQVLPAGAPPNFLRGASTGRLVAVTYGSNASAGDYYGYDELGRSVLKVQRTGGTNYQTSAAYVVSGRLSSLTYPSGHTLNYNYDQAGRLGDKDAQNLALTGNLGDGIVRNYSSGVSYNSWNALAQEKFGTDTPIYNKLFYNTRGQLSEIRESTSPNNTSWNRGAIINNYSNQCWGMCAGQSMTDNNGNLKRQDIYIPNNDQVSSYVTWADGYTYDDLNRLKQMHEYASNSQFDFQQEYLYDQWGNRRINQTTSWGAGIPKPDFNVNSTNNRLIPPAGYAMSYDAAGNLTNDTYSGQGQRTYDAENRMTQAWANSQWQTYTYDGNGARVRRNVNNLETWHIYGMSGELLAEYAANGSPSAPQKEYGYRNGQLLVTAASAPLAKLNVASATASNFYGPGNEASKATDGNVNTLWNAGGWSPQWIQLDLGAAYTLSKLRLLVAQSPNGPTTHQVYGGATTRSLSLLGTLDGSTTNGQWLEFNSSASNIRYVKVLTTSSPSWVAWSEIEVYGTLPSAVADVEWLVTDQLGTPRMIFDKTGSLLNTKRHDYLPFGEELTTGTGSRSSVQGYSVPDGIRQKFTQKERDTETGLDYFLARYYSSAHGRFTSTDPLLASGRVANPQTWNRYAYVLNNPLHFVDPSGLVEQADPPSGDQAQQALQPIKPPQELVNAIMTDLTQVRVAIDGQEVDGVMQLDQNLSDQLLGAITEVYTRGIETGSLAAASNGIAVPMQIGTQAGVGWSGTFRATTEAVGADVGGSGNKVAQKTYEVAAGNAVRADITNRAANAQTVERVSGNLQDTQAKVNTLSGPIQTITPGPVWRDGLSGALNKVYATGIRQGMATVGPAQVLPAKKPF